MPVAYSIASTSGTSPDGGIVSRQATSDAVSSMSAALPIATALPWTDCSVSRSFGRLSARPSVTRSQMFFAVPSSSRTSRRIGWSRIRSALSASAEGIRPVRPYPFCTASTVGVTGALTAT